MKSHPLTIQIVKKTDLDKLKIRFTSTLKIIEKNSDYEIIYFKLKPSDPDFPFDLDFLELELKVNVQDTPSSPLKVLNQDIPEELRSNIEMKWELESRLNIFDRIKWLDRHLESLLILPSIKESVPAPCESLQSAVKFIPFQNISLESPAIQEHSNDQKESNQECDPEDDQEDDQLDNPTLYEIKKTQKGSQIRILNKTLKNISLVQCTTFNMSIKCSRCKAPVDAALTQEEVWITCSTCSQSLGAQFIPNFIHSDVHSDSNILGYVDVSNGIVIADFLPSVFTVLCEQGHETVVKSAQFGIDYYLNCIQCHMNMQLNLDGIKCIKISTDSSLIPKNQIKRKPQKDTLGITKKGSNLPLNGTCEHYKKSFRWLRFPCCGKAYPCDTCHDLQTKNGHELTWANRMMCGFCSKEQPLNSKCCSCGKELTKNASGGFWEGGKGTRDRSKMSKRDEHKYKGVNKTVSQKSARVGGSKSK